MEFLTKPRTFDIYIKHSKNDNVKTFTNDIHMKYIDSISKPYTLVMKTDPSDFKKQSTLSSIDLETQCISLRLRDNQKNIISYVDQFIEELSMLCSDDCYDSPVYESEHGLDKLYNDLMFIFNMNGCLQRNKIDMSITFNHNSLNKLIFIKIDDIYVSDLRIFLSDQGI